MCNRLLRCDFPLKSARCFALSYSWPQCIFYCWISIFNYMKGWQMCCARSIWVWCSKRKSHFIRKETQTDHRGEVLVKNCVSDEIKTFTREHMNIFRIQTHRKTSWGWLHENVNLFKNATNIFAGWIFALAFFSVLTQKPQSYVPITLSRSVCGRGKQSQWGGGEQITVNSIYRMCIFIELVRLLLNSFIYLFIDCELMRELFFRVSHPI